MSVILRQRYAIKPWAYTGVNFEFTGKRIIENVSRETYSEWRIRPVGRRFPPRARWRRRVTDILRIEGRMPLSDLIKLRELLMLPFPVREPADARAKAGFFWSIEGLQDIGKDELWVWSERLTSSDERIFTSTGEQYYSFSLTLQWAGNPILLA